MDVSVWKHIQIKVEIKSTFPPEAPRPASGGGSAYDRKLFFKKIPLGIWSQDALVDVLGHYIFSKKKEKPLVGKVLDLGFQTEKRHIRIMDS